MDVGSESQSSGRPQAPALSVTQTGTEDKGMVVMGNKVYGEITLRFWADPELFAQEYGREPEAALECARSDFEEGAVTMDDRILPWRGAEVVASRTYDRDRTLEAYENWHALRTVIGHREEECAGTDPIDSDDWYTSDRDGVEFAHDLAAMLKPGDACGCKDVDIEQSEVDDTYTYTVQCVHCPNRWTVRDGEVVQVRAWADGHGNWHAAVTEQGMGHAASAQADALAAITRELVERGTELDAIQARMGVAQVARTSEHGKLETEFVETWKHPEA